MLDLSELAVCSIDEMIRKRGQLTDELAMLDRLIEHIRLSGATRARLRSRATMPSKSME
jgi:hypothetical protein